MRTLLFFIGLISTLQAFSFKNTAHYLPKARRPKAATYTDCFNCTLNLHEWKDGECKSSSKDLFARTPVCGDPLGVCPDPTMVGAERVYSFDSSKDVVIPKGYHCTYLYNRTKAQRDDENKLVFEFSDPKNFKEVA